MLGQYHYHSIFRKSIVAFGGIFNNILVKRKVDGNKVETIKCPIQYGPKQKFLAAIAANPTAQRQKTQLSLPRIGFEIRGLTYDTGRKLVPTQLATTVPQEGDVAEGQPVMYKQFMPVPYNLVIEMSIIAKNQDDGMQILEQILPNFHPTLNVSIEVIDETHEERDIAIQLDSVAYEDSYEGSFTERRALIWTLNFTVKTYLFGPVDLQKDIRRAVIDYRTDLVKRTPELRYTAEVASTEEPPKSRDEIDPNVDPYEVVETVEDITSADNDFFGL